MISPCLHYDCTNRNSFGYCKTTACINPKYNRLTIESTDNTFPAVVIKPCTNADRIRAMTDEELATIICCQDHKQGDECFDASCYDCTLDWLKQEVDE